MAMSAAECASHCGAQAPAGNATLSACLDACLTAAGWTMPPEPTDVLSSVVVRGPAERPPHPLGARREGEEAGAGTFCLNLQTRAPFACLKVPIALSVLLVLISGLFAGLTLGLMSLDKVGLQIIMGGGDEREQAYAKARDGSRESRG